MRTKDEMIKVVKKWYSNIAFLRANHKLVDWVVDFGSRLLLPGRMCAMLLSHKSKPHLIRQCMESLKKISRFRAF
jgi:hypothetical protein